MSNGTAGSEISNIFNEAEVMTYAYLPTTEIPRPVVPSVVLATNVGLLTSVTSTILSALLRIYACLP